MTYKIKVVIKFKMMKELLQKILSISQEGGGGWGRRKIVLCSQEGGE